jgi:hypothetical protein
MKKTLISMFILFVLFAVMFTGCEVFAKILIEGVVVAAEGVGNLANTVANIPSSGRKAAEAGRERTLNETQGYTINNGFNNTPEERLTRRTSTLAGGVTVDVTPYLLHESSFVVAENEIWYCRSVIDLKNVRKGRDVNNFDHYIFVFDITVTFEANSQMYRYDLNVVTSERNESRAKNLVKNDVKTLAAEKLGLRTNNIKKLNVVYNNSRRGDVRLTYGINNTIFQDIEPSYYQFDVEVEYLKTAASTSGFNRRPAEYAIFNKVYRSNFKSLVAAAVDVQLQIWNDVRTSGYRFAPLPIINFVSAMKFTM